MRVPTNLNKDQVLAAMENSSTPVAVTQTISAAEENEFVRYRIRSGELFSTIARRFRVSMATLIEVNELTRRTVLRAGRTLRVPKGSYDSTIRKPSSAKQKESKTNFVRNLK